MDLTPNNFLLKRDYDCSQLVLFPKLDQEKEQSIVKHPKTYINKWYDTIFWWNFYNANMFVFATIIQNILKEKLKNFQLLYLFYNKFKL